MTRLSEKSIPYQRSETVSLDGNGDFAAGTQNLLVTRLGNVVNITSDRKLSLDTIATVETQIEASNAQNGDKYGWSVDISEDSTRIVVGAIFEDSQGSNAGSVYVYDYNGSTWTETVRLDSGLAVAGEQLGRSVSISQDGNTIVTGAYTTDHAYVWRYNGSVWGSSQRIAAPAAGEFGRRVAVNGDGSRLIVGAPGDNKAYTYNYNGSTYVLDNTFTAPFTGRFGFGVSISDSGDTVVIGADQASTEGRAFIYDYNGSSWSLTDTLVPSDTGTIGSALFGNRVSISADGSTILVNAVLDNSNGSQSGSAYMFRLSGTWSEIQKLEDFDGSPSGDLYALDVALSSDGNRAVVSSYRDDTAGTNVGAAYTYTFNGSTWDLDANSPITPQDGSSDSGFGRSATISGDGSIVVICAEFGDGSVSNSGTAHIYEFSTSPVDGQWHSASSIIPTWARPSSTQSTDGGPRNTYSVTSAEVSATTDDDLVQDCWVKADGTFVLQLTELTTGDTGGTTSPEPDSSVVPVNITYVIA